mgnify:CR=1 FL=1
MLRFRMRLILRQLVKNKGKAEICYCRERWKKLRVFYISVVEGKVYLKYDSYKEREDVII